MEAFAAATTTQRFQTTDVGLHEDLWITAIRTGLCTPCSAMPVGIISTAIRHNDGHDRVAQFF